MGPDSIRAVNATPQVSQFKLLSLNIWVEYGRKKAGESFMKTQDKKRAYRVMFVNEGKVYEIYARRVSHGAMFGFVEVEGLLFGERTSVVVDPAEERLRTEFAGVDRTYIPMHSVIRIDEVEKKGTSKIHAVDDKEGKLHQLPSPIYTPVKREP